MSRVKKKLSKWFLPHSWHMVHHHTLSISMENHLQIT